MIIAILSRSIRRSALAEAVCGLTEFFHHELDLAAHDSAGRIDLFRSQLDAHDCIFAKRTQETGQRCKMSDANSIGLRLDDRRHTDCGEQRRAGRTLKQCPT